MSAQILVVEDDHATQTLLHAIMHREFAVDCAAAFDGIEALRLLETHSFDVVILDLLLPAMNGFELLRHLKANHPALLQTIVVITAAAERTFSGCAELRDVRCVLRKPLDITELVAHVQACVAAR